VKTIPLETKERIVERLVEVSAPADSASIKALLECNDKNQVILKQLSEEKSKSVQSKFSLSAGLLSYNFTTKPQIGFAKVRDTTIYKEKAVQVPYEVKINELTWWQRTQIILFRILVALIILLFLLNKLKSWFSISGVIGTIKDKIFPA
jgi:hypothetical protein